MDGGKGLSSTKNLEEMFRSTFQVHLFVYMRMFYLIMAHHFYYLTYSIQCLIWLTVSTGMSSGEGDIEVFKVDDLRMSRDWVYGSWIDIPCNPDAAAKAANPAKTDKSKMTNEVQMVSVKQQPSPNDIPSKVS